MLLFQIKKGLFLEKRGEGFYNPLRIGFSKDATYPRDILVQ
jgi:hypothetical protein